MALHTQHPRPLRLQRSSLRTGNGRPVNAVFVGPGSKWANPFKKADVDALRSEPDVEAAYQVGGWRQAAKLLYVDYLKEAGLNFRELRGRDLICTCKPSEPCHADVLLELANLD